MILAGAYAKAIRRDLVSRAKLMLCEFSKVAGFMRRQKQSYDPLWAGIGLILFTCAPAVAANDCYEAAKLYGAMMRASLLCNFPERPALGKAIALAREECPASSPEAFKEAMGPGVEEGFRTFDRELKRVGKKKACANWDEFIRLLGESPPSR